MVPNFSQYDHIIVYFSGGKDSLACALLLLMLGIPKSKIELWHHEVDGREGSELMDWPVTPDYCRVVAEFLGLPIFFSWKVGGFEREMLRNEALTQPTKFECPGGEIRQAGGIRGKKNTRLKFPQISANLSCRWCSAYLKVDVATIAINNQKRFKHSKTLTISGERKEESAARAKYNQFELDRADNRDGKKGRHIDRWRPVHKWSERQVWEIIEDFQIRPHPAYPLGWGRLSCMKCIFGSCNQFASARLIDPAGVNDLALYEEDFGYTIQFKEDIHTFADKGQPYEMDEQTIKIAMSKDYNESVFDPDWKLPLGAFGEKNGPT